MVMRMAPLGNGHVSEEDFHHLVAVPPRDIAIVLKLVEKDAIPGLIEAYRQGETDTRVANSSYLNNDVDH